MEAVHDPEHLVLPGSPQTKQLCQLHFQPSLGQSCHRQKKSCAYACRVASVMSDSSDCVHCGLPGFSVRERGSLGNTLQYSCLEKPTDRQAWKATVHRVTKSLTRPKQPCMHRCKTFFACGSSVPVRVEHEGGAHSWLVGTLAAPSVQ